LRDTQEEEEEIYSMLNIRMSRTPMRVPRVFYALASPHFNEVEVRPRTTKCLNPNSVGGFTAGRSPLRGRQRVEYLEECVHSPNNTTGSSS
jgi:hypothetical protein